MFFDVRYAPPEISTGKRLSIGTGGDVNARGNDQAKVKFGTPTKSKNL